MNGPVATFSMPSASHCIAAQRLEIQRVLLIFFFFLFVCFPNWPTSAMPQCKQKREDKKANKFEMSVDSIACAVIRLKKISWVTCNLFVILETHSTRNRSSMSFRHTVCLRMLTNLHRA